MNYIGVDLGGTNIVVALISDNGEIIEEINKPTQKERDIESIFDDIIEMCLYFIKKYALNQENLSGIGIGIPGTIDCKNNIILYSNNIKIENFNVQEYFNNKIKFKISIANDADCAALGEVVAGSAKGCSDAIIVTLGTGVGGGIVINNKIFSGFYPGGAELGHQIVEKDGLLCSCGNKGCLEAYASATGLINMSKAKAAKNPESLLYKMVNGDLEKINGKIPFDAAKENDETAINVVNDYIEYLSIGIANIVNIFKPEVVLLSGGISKQKDNLIVPLKEKVRKKIFGGRMETEIKVASLEDKAGLIGAAMLLK